VGEEVCILSNVDYNDFGALFRVKIKSMSEAGTLSISRLCEIAS
jgi:hypothetical protein